ncbi:MAG: hypothetical protein SVY41_00965 [Candidatus Nanohaloarchaea archaeon]|nr:hypothetical protein [Candidatus Nanohaloarchaea archaeon]
MNAIVFSWSGSFQNEFGQREDAIRGFVDEMQDRGMEVGIVTDSDVGEVDDLLPTDFEIPHVDDLSDVLGALTTKYEKVFFVSDVTAELATANQSGAFTVGLASAGNDAAELSGAGPNYVVESFEELEEILRLEAGERSDSS